MHALISFQPPSELPMVAATRVGPQRTGAPQNGETPRCCAVRW